MTEQGDVMITEEFDAETMTMVAVEKKTKDIPSEPLAKTRQKGVRAVRTQKQRMIDARVQLANGHVANPLGGADNRPRRLRPKRAREISPEGPVTVSQLNAHLLRKFDDAFRDDQFAERIPQDRGAMNAQFSELKQAFINYCEGFEPDDRNIAEYIDWMLEPSKVDRFHRAQQKSKRLVPCPAFVYYNQMFGAVYVRSFYDAVIKPRIAGKEKLAMGRPEAAEFWDNAFHAFREADGKSIRETANAMCEFGYAACVQWLHEERGLGAGDCIARISTILVEILKGARDFDAVARHLGRGVAESGRNARHMRERHLWVKEPEKVAAAMLAAATERAMKERGMAKAV